MDKDNRLAVLIDADNIPSAYINEMMEEITKYGNPTIKRIYGDWTSSRLTKWKNLLLDHAITPIQQYSYTTGKNSTDSALIIDAMDILYSDKVQGFCLVSSDSDFTRLATRLREAGMNVYGLGEQKTPQSFIAACDKFIYIEILKQQSINSSTNIDDKMEDSSQNTNQKQKVNTINKKVSMFIKNTIEDLADDDGWAFLGDIGNMLQKKQPNFDPRNYGFRKLTPMIQALGNVEVDRRESANSKVKLIYIRIKLTSDKSPDKESPKPNPQLMSYLKTLSNNEDSPSPKSTSKPKTKSTRRVQSKKIVKP